MGGFRGKKMRGSVWLMWSQVGERSESQPLEAREHGRGEVKGHTLNRQRQESRKVKDQVRLMLRKVTKRMRGQDELIERGKDERMNVTREKKVRGQLESREKSEWVIGELGEGSD